MNRRELLGVIATGTTVTAGCSRLSEPELALGRIVLENRTPSDVEVSVVVNRAETEVYRDTVGIEGEPGVVHGDLLVGDWLGETAEYEVSVDLLDGAFDARASTSDAVEYFDENWDGDLDDGTCFEFIVRIGNRFTSELDGIYIDQDIIVPEHEVYDYAESCG